MILCSNTYGFFHQMKRKKDAADKTLSKVRREAKEAKKMIETISRLQKLRDIRQDTAQKRGKRYFHFSYSSCDQNNILCHSIPRLEKNLIDYKSSR